MMTTQILTTELSSLIQESKRKYPDLRNAAEQSLSDLKALPTTSEAQLAADLKIRSKFARPFVIACSTRNPKCAGIGVTCLLRLVVSNGLSLVSLKDVLESFRECATLGLDVQLKVLQALPLLLQNYAAGLRGQLLISAFQVCFLLQGSRTAVVSNTAAASLQQFLAFTFDKITSPDETASHDEPVQTVPTQDGPIPVSGAEADAYYLLDDLCILAEGKEPNALRGAKLNPTFGLELIESILADHIDTVAGHAELIHVCRTRLIPLIIGILSQNAVFALTVRAMRLLRLLTSKLLPAMIVELEVAINQLMYVLDPLSSATWKRALGLEFFRSLHDDPTLLREIYARYDEQQERRNVVGDHLALLVRLAAEKPAVIGLVQQLSQIEAHQDVPPGPIALESGGMVGAIPSSTSEMSSNKTGLSSQWSVIRTPCIDQTDKTEPPELPATYVYALILTCINSFSEGLAKFLLPFTIPSDLKPKRRRKTASNRHGQGDSRSDDDGPGSSTRAGVQASADAPQSEGKLPVNPLTLEDHDLYSQIRTSASMVDHCWPALLAASSTFMNASLDSEYLHALIRSFQKFTQVAGLLELATPRDAFLTTLAKYAVPTWLADPSKTPVSGIYEGSEGDTDDDHNDSGRDPSPAPSASAGQRKQGNFRLTSVVTRNLLCLRALLNLGIALGPVLGDSWIIVFETLHQVDVALVASQSQKIQRNSSRGSMDHNDIQAGLDDNGLNTERKAVETAVSRLFQSTSDLPNPAFHVILDCLASLTYGVSKLPEHDNGEPMANMSKMLSPRPVTARHHRYPSISRRNMNHALATKDSMLLLDRTAQLASCNSSRLSQAHAQPSDSGWSVLKSLFIDHLGSPTIAPEIRISAARMLNDLVSHLVSATSEASPEHRDRVISRGIEALATAVSSLWQADDTKGSGQCSFEIHHMALEALTSILEHCGEIIRLGWDTVFSIINSIFVIDDKPSANGSARSVERSPPTLRSPKLVRPSFTSLQLLCSDFLTSVPDRCFLTLLDTQHHFASQTQDLNVSLTTVTLFRNTSDFLQRGQNNVEHFSIDSHVAACGTEPDLIKLIDRQDGRIPRSAVWVCVLLQLAQLITDSRLELRNGALQTLFGIVDASSNHLDAQAWTMCFRLVLFKLTAATELMPREESYSNVPPRSGWDDTGVLLVQGLSKTFIQALEVLSRDGNLTYVWDQLIARYTTLLSLRRLTLGHAVFSSLTEVLSVCGDAFRTHRIPLDSTWAVWRDHNPSNYDLQGVANNHDALVAYLQYIGQFHGLLDEGFNAAQAEAMMANLRLCITQSTPVVYGSDIDEMTTVQSLVLEDLKLIPTSYPEILVQLVSEIAFLVTLAFQLQGDRIQKGKSFVAVSKGAMDVMEGIVKQHVRKMDALVAILLSISLRALSIPIHLKYKRQLEGKGTPTWQKATSTALSSLDADLLLRACNGSTTDQQSMWTAITDISNGIAAADTDACDSYAKISSDQTFDIESLSQLMDIIIPTLGSPSIPDRIGRKYVESLFEHSLIHEPHPDDLARPNQELLDGLRSQHIGRVQELPPKLRSKMSYFLLDHLFDLVAVHDGSTERIKLAQAAAPYLILRAGLVLKAYVCDHPLRGLLPQPLSQKREMHYLLKKLIELNSQPKAFPQTMGVQSEHKKHLFLLFNLVTKALKVAWRDEEMSAALRGVLEAVGSDFGF